MYNSIIYPPNPILMNKAPTPSTPIIDPLWNPLKNPPDPYSSYIKAPYQTPIIPLIVILIDPFKRSFKEPY